MIRLTRKNIFRRFSSLKENLQERRDIYIYEF